MNKVALLSLGLLLLLIQNSFAALELNAQYFLFIAGIIFLGVPHGAADLLVASRNADLAEKKFSKNKFLFVYVGRLAAFAFFLFLLPVVGNIIFILFAAYHFGETDLHQFKTNTLPGKIFVLSYGLLILSVILLHHFDDVKQIYLMFESGKRNAAIINWLSQNRYYLLSANALIFFVSSFFYFIKNKYSDNKDTGQFLVRFALILFILFNLPLILGFTFYFVVWHSLISLTNIINYLRQKNKISYTTILKQILLYSSIAIAGIAVFGLTGFMYVNENAVAAYIFFGLAVLTAPHMEIMYEMYVALRNKPAEILT